MNNNNINFLENLFNLHRLINFILLLAIFIFILMSLAVATNIIFGDNYITANLDILNRIADGNARLITVEYLLEKM